MPLPVPVPARKAFSPNRGPPSPIPIPSVNLQHAPCSLDGLLGGTRQPALRTMHASHHITYHSRQKALSVQEEANFLVTVVEVFLLPLPSPLHHLTISPSHSFPTHSTSVLPATPPFRPQAFRLLGASMARSGYHRPEYYQATQDHSLKANKPPPGGAAWNSRPCVFWGRTSLDEQGSDCIYLSDYGVDTQSFPYTQVQTEIHT